MMTYHYLIAFFGVFIIIFNYAIIYLNGQPTFNRSLLSSVLLCCYGDSDYNFSINAFMTITILQVMILALTIYQILAIKYFVFSLADPD